MVFAGVGFNSRSKIQGQGSQYPKQRISTVSGLSDWRCRHRLGLNFGGLLPASTRYGRCALRVRHDADPRTDQRCRPHPAVHRRVGADTHLFAHGLRHVRRAARNRRRGLQPRRRHGPRARQHRPQVGRRAHERNGAGARLRPALRDRARRRPVRSRGGRRQQRFRLRSGRRQRRPEYHRRRARPDGR